MTYNSGKILLQKSEATNVRFPHGAGCHISQRKDLARTPKAQRAAEVLQNAPATPPTYKASRSHFDTLHAKCSLNVGTALPKLAKA